jgi:hypothetical protein
MERRRYRRSMVEKRNALEEEKEKGAQKLGFLPVLFSFVLVIILISSS